jgi:hypothetical protein
MVNRIWQGHFGRGIVANGNDFGIQTDPPSHPQLLDWLSAEFVGQGWDIKALHRLMMTSQAYRQRGHAVVSPAATGGRQSRLETAPGGKPSSPAAASERADESEANRVARALVVDSGNQLYWHYPRRRLNAESIRDAMLAVAETLNVTMYGPGVYPELPPDYSGRHAWKVSEDESQRNRRSVYIHAARNLPYPLLQVFDLPDMHESCALRSETTVAPQALMVLNSEMIVGFAEKLAGRLLAEHPSGDMAPLVERAWLLAYARPPAPAETNFAVAFIDRQTQLIAARQSKGETIALPPDLPKFTDASRAAAVIDFCHALVNSNEFLYVD